MRRFMLSFGLLLFVANVGRADPFTLDNIQLWVGTGSKRAALVIDFKAGPNPQSLAWGYRWDGTATGEDMLRAIAGSNDAGLRSGLQFFTGFGYFPAGFGFDENRDGQFAVTPSLAFINGIADVTSVNEGRASTNPADRYRELGTAGFWAYYNKDTAASPWTFASLGMSSRVLSDGNFDGWSAVADFNDPAVEPSEPISVAAVPESSSMILLALTGSILLVVWRTRRRRLVVG